MFQPMLDVACVVAKTAAKGTLNTDKANGKGKVRLECAATICFMFTWGQETLINGCLTKWQMNAGQVVGQPQGEVFKKWWVMANNVVVGGGDVRTLTECSIRMGQACSDLQWGKY